MRSDVGYKLNLSSLPNLVFTLLICAACWGIGLYHKIGYPVQSGNDASILWDAICRMLPAEIGILYLTGFILLVLGAALLQRFNFLYVIIKEKTTLPFLFFIILVSVNPAYYPIQPISLAFFLLMFAMFELYRSYQKPKVISRMFNMMLYLSAGSLFLPYLLFFIPLFWLGMYNFRIINVRTFTATLLGLFTIFWFALGWCVWKHDYSVFINLFECLIDIRLIFSQENWLVDWLAPLCAFFVIIVLYIHFSLLKHANTIRTHHFLTLLFIFGVVSFMLAMCYASAFEDFIGMFYLSVSIIVSFFFSGKYGIISFLLYYFLVIALFSLFLIRIWNF